MRKTHKSFIFIFIMVSFFSYSINCFSFIQMFGLEDLVVDLVKASPTVHFTGQESVSYAVDDKLLNFLKNFQTRTRFCDYKCPNFYQIPCFILFQCNIQLRNFFLIIIFPIILIAMIALCCGRGIWTFSCWARYIGLFTGIFFVIWFFRKLLQGYQKVQRRKRQRQILKKIQQSNEIDIQPVLTQKRLKQER